MRSVALRAIGPVVAMILFGCSNGQEAGAAPLHNQQASAGEDAAPSPDAAVHELTEAATILRQRVETAIEERSAPPTLGDPANAVLIEAAFNRGTLRGLPETPTVVKSACTPVMAAGLAYATYLAAGSRAGAAEDTDARVAQLQDELALAFAAEDLCSKRLFGIAAAEHGSGEAAVANAHQMQRGAIQIQTGMIMAQGDSTVKPANQELMLNALLEDPEAIAAGLTLAQRGDIRDRIDSVLPDARPDAQAELKKLRAAYDGTGCTGLCALTNVAAKAGPQLPARPSAGSAEPR